VIPLLKKIQSLLVANRGEIALRVIRACGELGIKSIAIYSDEDTRSVHVKRADKAYYLGPPSPSESYLNINKIIEIATKVGADAIHPGYGFLSENENFPELCSKNGIIFIGPKKTCNGNYRGQDEMQGRDEKSGYSICSW
jgi:acetyl-CoA/propionyl-CoA carboxylase